jgi:hypothetical protein
VLRRPSPILPGMAQVPAAPRDRIRVTECSELESSPRAIVRFGNAPDGLPWLLEVDRSHRLQLLFDTVLQVFELGRRDELPDRVRVALERDVASGLMGIHWVDVAGDGPAMVYVSRKKLKHLLGPTLLSQILEARAPALEPSDAGSVATNVGALAARDLDVQLVEAVERSIHERRAKRHMVVRLADGAAFSGSVQVTDRALRSPGPPFRPLAFESLAQLGDVEAVLETAAGEQWRTPLADWEKFSRTLLRLHQSPRGGGSTFEISRARLIDALVAAARGIGALHRRELVHADIAPGNLLLGAEGPTSFDSLDVKAGHPATAATFEWAAPEQIVGHPVDPRTDVYALGKIATAVIGGVPFGEETNYVVPVGGDKARRVKLLKAEGVFIDILDSPLDRDWQMAWQAFLGRSVAFDAGKRPRDAGQFADELADLASRHPPVGRLACPGDFGPPVPMETPDGWTFARLARD